ncbi:tetracycline resistance MFS efflux pump [Actinoplanes sp. OR16]|uniref:MFS transporter n=1 Tax=Actinoplanes sp. OR16 TaxID=946334 RepID=UPI000F720A92|nr:MFS transporter [Actinoplanes sp. OR16]BBH69854.1 tetracycline resistance MFS efflux pump [Actinoplanes sp. OR16]
MRLSFLLVTVFLDMLGLGVIVPILPSLMTAVTGSAAGAVYWSGLLGSAYGLLQFAVSPLLGRLSDRYGRRPVLLLSLTCLGVDWLAHAAVPEPWALLFFHGLAGACAGTSTVVNAYVADVTPEEGRARAYGRIGAAYALGFVAGPLLGGLLGAVDVRLPFLAAAGLSFAGVAWGRLVLPESHRGDRSSPVTFRMANPVGAITVVLRRAVLGRLAYARLCADVARMIQQSVWTFFLAYQFGFGTTQAGVVMAAGATAGAVFQARATGPVVRLLGDKRAAITGTLIGAASFAGIALSTGATTLYLWSAVGVLGSYAGAATQSWISRTTPAAEQGTVQGALTGLSAIAETLVPLAASTAFGLLLAHDAAGLVLMAAAAAAALSATVLFLTPAPAAPITGR